jgi:hypothetical protein
MTVKAKYIVPIPVMPDNTTAFNFDCNIPSGRFHFDFRWNEFKNGWSMYVTIPGGEIRQAGVWPNVISWSQYCDFSIQTITDMDSIGINDLDRVSMYLLVGC